MHHIFLECPQISQKTISYQNNTEAFIGENKKGMAVRAMPLNILFRKTIFICHRGLQRYPEELYLR